MAAFDNVMRSRVGRQNTQGKMSITRPARARNSASVHATHAYERIRARNLSWMVTLAALVQCRRKGIHQLHAEWVSRQRRTRKLIASRCYIRLVRRALSAASAIELRASSSLPQNPTISRNCHYGLPPVSPFLPLCAHLVICGYLRRG